MQELIFTPSTSLTFATALQNKRKLTQFYLEAKPKELVLDLGEVEHCDSAGLALLIEAQKLANTKQTLLKLKGVSEHIIALAKFCGVATLLGLDDWHEKIND